MEELENVGKYEKQIGLKTIWLTLVRRWQLILCIFVPISLLSVLVTQAFMTKTYQSGFDITFSTNISGSLTGIQNTIKNKSTTDEVSANLRTTAQLDISSDYIYSNISFGKLDSANTTFSVYFQSTNKGIVEVVAKAIKDVAVPKLSSVSATSDVTEVSKNSKENTYMLIGFAIAAVFALGFPFAYEIVSDEVYDKDDVNDMGGNGFEVTVLTKKK